MIGVGVDIGILLAFVLGTYYNYNMTPIVAIFLTVLFIVLFSFFPETPLVLVKRNQILVCKAKKIIWVVHLVIISEFLLQKAEKSIRFYKNITEITDDGDKLVQNEIEKLKRQIKDFEKSTTRRLKLTDLTTNPGRKAMIIGIVLSLANNLCGTFIITYAAKIFGATGSVFSENESALIVAVILLCGTSTLPFVVDRIGRKVW